MAFDRLSVLAIRLNRTQRAAQTAGNSGDFRRRLLRLSGQLEWLAEAIDALLDDVRAGRRRFVPYEHLKLYAPATSRRGVQTVPTAVESVEDAVHRRRPRGRCQGMTRPVSRWRRTGQSRDQPASTGARSSPLHRADLWTITTATPPLPHATSSGKAPATTIRPFEGSRPA